MRRIFILLVSFAFHIVLFSQSKSIEKFRKVHQEDQNVFFYSTTLKMLNTENTPEFKDVIKDIEKIMVLHYKKENQRFSIEDITQLKANLKKEKYVELIVINENVNKVNLYKRDKKDRTVGFTALVDNKESLVLIDVKGSIDFKEFMDLKNKIDLKF